MLQHVGPSFVNSRKAIPEREIVLEDGLLGKEHVGHVQYLGSGDGSLPMIGHVDKIINGIEYSVDRENNRVEGIKNRHFLCLDLLWCDLAIGGK